MADLSPPPSRVAKPAVVRTRSILHACLHLCGFLAMILLMTWGLFALFFLVLGGFSLDGMMSQLFNLSSRYVGAGHERIASFKQTFAIAHLAVSGVLIVLRRDRMFPTNLEKGSIEHG